MQKGILTNLTPMGCYGFILDADSREVFFHSSALERVDFDDLVEGDSVAFDTVDDAYGLRATCVRAVAAAHPEMILEEALCMV
ncbi:MAG: cold shock domain-containing protein [Planctomycetes bacterium]|nr:cold shock domain-containing protein [Planctomycetota bacterium]